VIESSCKVDGLGYHQLNLKLGCKLEIKGRRFGLDGDEGGDDDEADDGNKR